MANKAKGAVEGAKGSAQSVGNKAQGSVQQSGGDVKKVAQQGNLNFISLLQLPSPQVCQAMLDSPHTYLDSWRPALKFVHMTDAHGIGHRSVH